MLRSDISKIEKRLSRSGCSALESESWYRIKEYCTQPTTTNKASIDITNLKRYDVVDDVNCNGYEIFESDDGDYVKFEDIKKLLYENN